MTHFDETSGTIPCKTSWGQWYQTMEEVFVEVNVPEGTKAKEIKCNISPKTLSFSLKDKEQIKGNFVSPVQSDDSVWTLEDRKLVRICLIKCDKTPGNCWKSLLEGQYEADPITYEEMQKKMTLQRFQLENPGFDFSGAEVTGNYQGGGPQFPS